MCLRVRRTLVLLLACAASLLGCAAALAAAPPAWPTAAQYGIQELMGSGDGSAVSWDSQTALWGGHTPPNWWQSGLAVLTLARYAERTRDRDSMIQRVLLRTYALNRERDFTNNFMDDTAWWALGWFAAARYELAVRDDRSAAASFLAMAENDASYIARQPRPCGGIEWAVGYPADTITNAQFVVLAAELSSYREAPGPFHDARLAQRWLAQAKGAWGWLRRSGLLNLDTGEVARDSLGSGSCRQRVGGPVTYTQGEVAEAALELGVAAQDPSYFGRAERFLSYAIDPHGDFMHRGILQDRCEAHSPNCRALPARLDVTSYKGILMQAFDDYSRTTGSGEFTAFLRTQARAIVSRDILGASARHPGCTSAHACQFGFSWARALSPMLVTVGSQESALDALTAVLS